MKELYVWRRGCELYILYSKPPVSVDIFLFGGCIGFARVLEQTGCWNNFSPHGTLFSSPKRKRTVPKRIVPFCCALSTDAKPPERATSWSPSSSRHRCSDVAVFGPEWVWMSFVVGRLTVTAVLCKLVFGLVAWYLQCVSQTFYTHTKKVCSMLGLISSDSVQRLSRTPW